MSIENLQSRYIEITGKPSTDRANLKLALKKSKIIMVGEDHNDDYCRKFIEQLIKEFNPKYFLTEHTQYLSVYPNEFKKRLDTLGKDGLPKNNYTEYWLKIGMKYNIPFIGMDYKPKNNELKDFEKVVYKDNMVKSFKLRETDMCKDIHLYSKKGKILVQVGDSHLRTTKSKYFGDASPLYTEFASREDVTIFRLDRKYQECP